MKKRIAFSVLSIILLFVAGCNMEPVNNNSPEEGSSQALDLNVDAVDAESNDLPITELDIDETELENLDI